MSAKPAGNEVWIFLIAAPDHVLANPKSVNESWDAWLGKNGVSLVDGTSRYGYWGGSALGGDQAFAAVSVLIGQLEENFSPVFVEMLTEKYTAKEGWYIQHGRVSKEQYEAVRNGIRMIPPYDGRRVVFTTDIPAIGLVADGMAGMPDPVMEAAAPAVVEEAVPAAVEEAAPAVQNVPQQGIENVFPEFFEGWWQAARRGPEY